GLALRDRRRLDDGHDAGPRRVPKLDAGIPAPEHLELLLGRRVIHERLEQEAVLLRFGQRIGPLVLDRVLRGEHHEGVGQRILLTLEADTVLLHRFQQRGLHFCRSAIDLVGQQDVGEDRALADAERARLQVVDRRSDDVRRHQVGRELDPTVVQREQASDRLGQQRLAYAGDTLEQDVALRDQGNGAEAHRLVLADDRLGCFRAKTRVKIGGFHADSFIDGYARSCNRRAILRTSTSLALALSSSRSARASSAAAAGARCSMVALRRSLGTSPPRPTRWATARRVAENKASSVTRRAPVRCKRLPTATAYSA